MRIRIPNEIKRLSETLHESPQELINAAAKLLAILIERGYIDVVDRISYVDSELASKLGRWVSIYDAVSRSTPTTGIRSTDSSG